MCQVLEHLPTEKQYGVVQELMRIGEHGVIIFPEETNVNYWLDPDHKKYDEKIKTLPNLIKFNGEYIIKW
jgi:hypothetical protein